MADLVHDQHEIAPSLPDNARPDGGEPVPVPNNRKDPGSTG
jgi:hypothetical protein